jgi:IS605 OrfB family transposase
MVARQAKVSDSRTRVYKYGAVPIGPFPSEGMDELWRANKLWNQLVEIHNNNRNKYEEARCAASSDYALISESIKLKQAEIEEAYQAKRQARMHANTKDAQHPLLQQANQTIENLKKEIKKLWELAKPKRSAADEKINKVLLREEFNEAIKAAKRIKNSAISSVLADQIGEYFKTARDKAFKDNATLRFHRFDGTGFFFYRFRRAHQHTDGVSFEELFDNNPLTPANFCIQSIDQSRVKKPRLRLRVKVAGGAVKANKIYAVFDLVLHRPLPSSGQIQNAKLTRTRIGDKFAYSICFTVKEEMPKAPLLNEGAIGVDIGFRQTKDGLLRAAALGFIDSQGQAQGEVEFLDVSEKLMQRMGDEGHVNQLKTNLDQAANILGMNIKPLLKAGQVLPEEHPKYKMVKAVANMPGNITLSFERAYKLSTWLMHEPDALPGNIVNSVQLWRKTNGRSYRELHNLRAKALLERKHLYREIAANLVRHRKPIGIERITLTKFAETKDADNKLGNKSRANRFLVSVSELLGAIKNAAEREGVPVYEVPPRNTSKTCSVCNHVQKTLQHELRWICANCATEHDRDQNAAINIARLALEKHAEMITHGDESIHFSSVNHEVLTAKSMT